jgi:hypothetical protein
MTEGAILEIAKLLLENAPIIVAIKDALTGGVTKEQIAQAIRAVQVEASDEIMREKLGLE